MAKKENLRVCLQCKIVFYDIRLASATCPQCKSPVYVEKIDW